MGAFLLELLLQLLLEFIVAPLLELAFEPFAKAVDRSRLPLFGLTMISVGGAGIGLIFSALFDERLVQPLVPGASLVLSPLLLGGLMHFFGRWRQSKGHNPTVLATFLGGAALGLGIAGGRLIGVLG